MVDVFVVCRRQVLLKIKFDGQCLLAIPDIAMQTRNGVRLLKRAFGVRSEGNQISVTGLFQPRMRGMLNIPFVISGPIK
jgi:hypothetical protein